MIINNQHNNYYPQFTAMKKSQFKGVDLFAVNTFKAPIEKFNDMKDFQNWAKTLLNEKINLNNYKHEYRTVDNERMNRLKTWKEYILNDNPIYTAIPALALIVFNAISKNLKRENYEQPPVFNAGALAKTVEEMEIILNTKNPQFNFIKHYENNLRTVEMGMNTQTAGSYTGWIKIPSQTNDPENFTTNVEKLKTLSHPNWCTASFNARPYLAKGDFHLFMDNGNPKVGIRFEKDKVAEIQGELNNQKIPLEYYQDIFEHLNTENAKLSQRAEGQLTEVKHLHRKLMKFLKKYPDAIENIDIPQLLKIMGIYESTLPDGTYQIISFSTIDNDYLEVFKALEISEEMLLENVSEVSEDIILEASNLKTFNKLKKVGGQLYINKCPHLESLGTLKEVGTLTIDDAPKLTSLGELKKVNKIATIVAEALQTLGNLEYVGRDLICDASSIKTLSKLKFVGGGFVCNENLNSTGELEEVSGNANFDNSNITSLGKLKKVGGVLRLEDVKLLSKPNLEYARKIIQNQFKWYRNFCTLEEYLSFFKDNTNAEFTVSSG